MPGLSKDPEKAKRQLAPFARNNARLAERLERGDIPGFAEHEPGNPPDAGHVPGTSPAPEPSPAPTPLRPAHAAQSGPAVSVVPYEEPRGTPDPPSPEPDERVTREPEPVPGPTGGGDPEPEPEPEPERRGGFLYGLRGGV